MTLAILLSTAIGLSLGILGGGGSILTVPILVYALGVEERAALASSLLVVGATSLVALIRPARHGQVAWAIGLTFAGGGMLGSLAGGWASAWIPKSALLLGFAGMMLATGVAMLRGRADTDAVHEPRLPLVAAIGVLVGGLTGLVGAGGGFLIVPALTLAGGLPMRRAIGTSLLVIAMQSAAGFAGHATHVSVDAPLVATVSAAACGGAVLGGAIGARLPQASLRRGFGDFVLGMAVWMIARELAG